jgi:hypothetical protein
VTIIFFNTDKNLTGAIVSLGTVFILGPAFLNGAPFFYFDTASYIEQIAKASQILLGHSDAAETSMVTSLQAGAGTGAGFGVAETDKIVFSGRSAYYGVLAWLGWISSIWLPVALQAATLSWLVVTLFRHSVDRWWWQTALLTLGGLSFFNSAGFFAGLVMPDIWAGLMVLALALLWVCPDRLSLGQKVFIFAIMSFSALVHNSHLALLAALLGGIVLLRFFVARLERAPLSRLALPVIALCIGVAGQMIYGVAVRVAYDAQLLSRPHITAHLIDLGPGTQLVQDSCPDSGYALCAYADRLPMSWIDFMFDPDPETGGFGAAPPAVQKALVAEQLRFAAQTLIHYPGQTLYGLARDGVAQLWTLDLEDVALSTRNADFVANKFPPDLSQMIERSRIYDQPSVLDTLLRMIQSTSGAATGFLLLYAVWRSTRIGSANPQLDRMVLLVVAGVVLNALICGILASPYGRFQARIIWLLPLAAALILSNLLASKDTQTTNFTK